MAHVSPEVGTSEPTAVDGASPTRASSHPAVLPYRGLLLAAAAFCALQAREGPFSPLVPQPDPSKVTTLGFLNFPTEHGIHVPGPPAAVVLSMLPIFIVYLFARRALVQGLMGVGGK